MPIRIIETPIEKSDLAEIAKERFGDLVKAVVDIELGIMAIGAELHSDEESLLLEQGSQQQHLWGVNLYHDKSGSDFIEFDSMINLRPSQGNRTRGVSDPLISQKIIEVINRLVKNT